MKRIVICLIVMMIISLSGCSWKKSNPSDNKTIENHDTSDVIDNKAEDEYDDKKDQTVINNDLPGPEGNSEIVNNDDDNNTADGSSESGQIMEDLKIEIGEDQNIGGL